MLPPQSKEDVQDKRVRTGTWMSLLNRDKQELLVLVLVDRFYQHVMNCTLYTQESGTVWNCLEMGHSPEVGPAKFF